MCFCGRVCECECVCVCVCPLIVDFQDHHHSSEQTLGDGEPALISALPAATAKPHLGRP